MLAGATLQNVIIGKNQAEGVHCSGPCTLKFVWFEDVCEDAITVKGDKAGEHSWIIGGGAYKAADKIVQHNGCGTVNIINFYANDYGKLYRSCGNKTDRISWVNSAALNANATSTSMVSKPATEVHWPASTQTMAIQPPSSTAATIPRHHARCTSATTLATSPPRADSALVERRFERSLTWSASKLFLCPDSSLVVYSFVSTQEIDDFVYQTSEL
ncbi:hypothetical protein FRC15_010840 [Serendipita sp. 397]|nr:hypothetical protein FRC15_010840 [Serendipita sp. 397]